ncbi:Ni/Fe hydrogenase subunit gamma [Ectothiorhodospira shaposhnikovii]|uniref:FAD/NAD(P)-binding protein n=1 Tax=Ectothiorhodospira shaposhnikovii TaxID=1054 RepID=UPI0019058217|nr:FAD/NAD(P)-binding protein [Ectothiorhodospira shaposhnikovii]MBK1672264.1 Ni/Fe hydrogenase subunit gamma [Ectothiorhodospira shaposhnikovii]
MRSHPDLPLAARVVGRVQETRDIFSLRLALLDATERAGYRSVPGQYNMLYLFGVGEVPISIVSDPDDGGPLEHTIRAVGRVTHGLERLRVGDTLGLRGPYGRGWPLDAARGSDVIVVTGGLGCAPVISMVRHMLRHRETFGFITLLQGVKHAEDLIWRRQYQTWAALPDVQVLLASDQGGMQWPHAMGNVTTLLDQARIPADGIAMLCGPERMMKAVIPLLTDRGMDPFRIWLSIERNMQCGIGHCGHCQVGPHFICQDGPVFRYPDIADWIDREGF